MNILIVNFLLHYFISQQQTAITIFNCWQRNAQEQLLRLAQERLLLLRLVNLNVSSLDVASEGYLLGSQSRSRVGIFLDMNCRQSPKIVELASRLKLFNVHYQWLIHDGLANVTEFRRIFDNVDLALDADVTFSIPAPDPSNANNETLKCIQYDVYNNGYRLGGKLNMTLDREILCDSRGCVLDKHLSDLHRRSRYNNRNRQSDVSFRVSTVVTKRPLDTPEPQMFAHLRSTNDTSVDAICRFGFILNDVIRDLLYCNMTYQFTDRWTTNATHGGSVGALATDTADFASTPFLLTSERMEYVLPLHETNTFRSVCLFRTPRNTGFDANVLFLPFDWPVWIFYAVALAVIAVILWGAFYLESWHHMGPRHSHHMPSLLTTFLVSLGVACQQGSHLIPKTISGRLAFLTLLMLSYIMYNFYTSLVVSILLGKPVKSSLSNLQELADSSLEVKFEPLPFTFSYLNSSKVSSVRYFVKRRVEAKHNKVWMSAEAGVRRVRDQPGFVFVTEASSAFPLVERIYQDSEICDLNEIMLRPEKSLYTHLKRGSPYLELLRLRILRIMETGVQSKHYRYWTINKLHCYGSNNFLVEVGTEYTALLFIMLVSVYVLVSLILILEILYKRWESTFRRKIVDMCVSSRIFHK